MKIIKSSGEIVGFNAEKLKISLLKSGADYLAVENILKAIQSEIYDGISTKKIYKLAFSLLKKTGNSHAARYNLRASIQMLGPTGFFFEKYVARIFESEQCSTITNLTIFGKCVSHEIDVVIKKDNVISMVECKFHASQEAKTDVKVPMYILSRFNDIKDKSHRIYSNKDFISNCWIVTNNRFTTDAIDFAKCMNLKLLSWNYPSANNLKTKNDSANLYPVTCLTTLTMIEKEKLLVHDFILVKELVVNPDALQKIGVSDSRIKHVLKEARELCAAL